MQVSAQFADSLYALERLQALRLTLWGGVSLLLGSLQLGHLQLSKRDSKVLVHFGVQSAVWGGLWIVAAMLWRAAIQMRDLAGAVALDRALWFAVGGASAVAVCAAGVILFARGGSARGTLLGVSVGVLTQAIAIAILALQLSAAIVR